MTDHDKAVIAAAQSIVFVRWVGAAFAATVAYVGLTYLGVKVASRAIDKMDNPK